MMSSVSSDGRHRICTGWQRLCATVRNYVIYMYDIILDVTNLFVGIPNWKQMPTHDELLIAFKDQLGTVERFDRSLIEPWWYDDAWDAVRAQRFIGLYTGTGDLYTDALRIVQSLQHQGSPLLVHAGDSTTASHRIDAVFRRRLLGTYDLNTVQDAINWACVCAVWTTFTGAPMHEHHAPFTVRQYLTSRDATTHAETLTVAYTRANRISIAQLNTLTTFINYLDQQPFDDQRRSGLLRVCILLRTVVIASTRDAVFDIDTFCVGRLRIPFDRYRFMFADSSLRRVDLPPSDDRDVIMTTGAAIVTRDAYAFNIPKWYGWRTIAGFINTYICIWNVIIPIVRRAWYSRFSVRSLFPSFTHYYSEMECTTTTVNGAPVYSIQRHRYGSILADYHAWLQTLAAMRRDLNSHRHVYMENQCILYVATHMAVIGCWVYGTTTHMLIRPMIVLCYNIMLFFSMVVMLFSISGINTIKGLIAMFIYNPGEHRWTVLPPLSLLRDVVGGTVRLLITGIGASIYWMITGVVLIFVDALVHLCRRGHPTPVCEGHYTKN